MNTGRSGSSNECPINEYQDKTKEELIKELEELKQAHENLKTSFDKDICRGEQVQSALNQSERNYRLLAQNSSDVIWTLDNDYRFTYISPSIYYLRGLTVEEAMQETIYDTMTPHSQEVVHKAMLEGKENEKAKNYIPVNVEIEQYHKCGQLIWVEIIIRAMLNDDGEKIGYVGISRNITKRKKAEKALTESIERFDSLLTKVPVGIYIFWIRASGHMEFEYVSDRWCEIHQISREEALADVSQVHKLIHKDDSESFLLLNREAARNLKTFVWEGRFMSGGELRWFRIESIPVRHDNGDTQWYGATQDITTRKQAEEALRESEVQLRELNLQKDKFFSIIAHDLKTPFNAILGFSELLTDQVIEKNYNEANEYAMIIRQSAKSALDLLTNLLEWSRAKTGRMQFSPESFDLATLIEENRMLLDVIADRKAITINTVVPHNSMVFADKQMISTVLRNLILNAIKYTRQGGEINISVDKRGPEMLVSVRDNGIGITTAVLVKLFRIDENASTPGTCNETGTGLGLILCKEFVENHGGKIWVESEQGKGSTFTFTIRGNTEQLN
jgi:PAS domain S-box-containing protein